MQGCPFASIAFALVVKWLVSQMTHSGLDEKQFFMDDGLLYGSPEAMKWCLDLMEKLEAISGLKLKWTKMSVHSPNSESTKLCKQLLPDKIKIIEDKDMNFVYLKTPIGTDKFVESYLQEKMIRLRREIKSLSEMSHLHECFTLLRSCASACKVTHLMRTIPPHQLKEFLNNFDSELRKAMEKILGHGLSDKQWLVCQLPAKYGGFGLRSGKLVAGAQHVMSLQKCAGDMETHAKGWNLRQCATESSQAWLKDCIGSDFEIDKYLAESDKSLSLDNATGDKAYSMSLAQRCEWFSYLRLLKTLSKRDRTRLLSNSGPTQIWVTALPLSWKNWNLTSKEWLIAARRRLGLDVRTKRTRCSQCKFSEIGLKGDHALRCSGKMGTHMRHDALKLLVARAFKQAGFEVKIEQGGGLHDRRRPGDVEVQDWVVVRNWEENTSLSIDVAIIDPTGDSHFETLRSGGVGAAATKYEARKRNHYRDMKGKFSPFIIEAHGGFGTEAKRLVRELERRRKERKCVPNVRNTKSFQPLGEINLVTAIGFELVRRNVRMILDRSPEDEPLIPAEKTKIRLEMSRNKRKVEKSSKRIYEKQL